MGMLVKLIRLLNDALGLTSIIVSHDVPETASIADYIYVIADGKVIGHGAPQDLMNSRPRSCSSCMVSPMVRYLFITPRPTISAICWDPSREIVKC